MESTYYAPISRENKQKLLKIIGKTLDDLKKGLQEIKAWLKTQKHLPEEPSDRMTEFYLIMTRFDMEVLKEKIDYYYTVRSQMPEVFTISNPRLSNMQETLNFTQIVPLPQLINNSDRVIVVKLKDALAPYDFDPHFWLAAIHNITEVMMQQSPALHNIMIYDLENLSLGHVLRVTPKFIINSAKLLEDLFSDNVRYLHVINHPKIFDFLLTIIKPLLKPKSYKKIMLHHRNESLAQYVPLDILPEDYNGKEKSLDELEVLWRAKLAEYQDRFDKLDHLRVNESLRTTTRIESVGWLESFSRIVLK